VIGNRIGTNAAGTGALGNTAEGVLVSRTGTTIGEPDRPNTIAFNGAAGIRIESGTGNRISSNSIFANGTLGIDLAPTGVTANDSGDADTGPNELQNFPVVTSAQTSGGITTFSGTLDSRPSTEHRVEFFDTANCDPSRFGEGRIQILATDVTTDSSGRVSFTRSATQAAVDGHFVTATATDPDGNTSEFSRCVRVNNLPPVCTEVAPSRSELWPPNHKLVAVTLSGATDPEGDPLELRITGVTQDEPLTGTGDNTSPDAVVRDPGIVSLRAERAPRGDGRVYRIAFEVSDGNEGTCTGTVSVQVRRSSGPAIDSSPPVTTRLACSARRVPIAPGRLGFAVP